MSKNGFVIDLSPFKNVVRTEPVSLNSSVTRLHYRVTSIMLFAASLIVTIDLLSKHPMQCYHPEKIEEAVNPFCWIHSTHTIATTWNVSVSLGRLPHTRVAPLSGVRPDEFKYHKSYQWVPLVLFIQGVSFYLPRFLWKTFENGKVLSLINELRDHIKDEEIRKKELEHVIKFFCFYRGQFVFYALQFHLCELLFLVNLIFQIYATDYFLDHEFHLYGPLFWSHVGQNHAVDGEDPFAKVFPKVTKCLFQRYGPSGTAEKMDYLCVLTLNILNEKIYFAIWVWFLFLTIITTIYLIYLFAVAFLPILRLRCIMKCGGRSLNRNQVYELINQDNLNRMQKLGDWFMLYLLFSNLDPISVNEIIALLIKSEYYCNTNSSNQRQLPTTVRSPDLNQTIRMPMIRMPKK